MIPIHWISDITPSAPWIDEHPVLFSLIIIAGFLVVFPVFWCGVVWLISRCGWSRLARHYAIAKPPPGESERVMCAMVGIATYRGVLRYLADAEGFYLWAGLLFRAGHAPLYIPWSDVAPGTIENRRRYQFVVLKVGDPHIATVRLMGISLDRTPLAEKAE
jgi:hypothetical protein